MLRAARDELKSQLTSAKAQASESASIVQASLRVYLRYWVVDKSQSCFVLYLWSWFHLKRPYIPYYVENNSEVVNVFSYLL